MDFGDRTEEGGGQGKERGRDWNRRNGRVHRKGTDLSAAGEAKQRWGTRGKSSLRQTPREGIAQKGYMGGRGEEMEKARGAEV